MGLHAETVPRMIGLSLLLLVTCHTRATTGTCADGEIVFPAQENVHVALCLDELASSVTVEAPARVVYPQHLDSCDVGDNRPGLHAVLFATEAGESRFTAVDINGEELCTQSLTFAQRDPER